MDTNQNLLNNELQIDVIAHSHLKETAMWAKFISIVGIILSILLAIAAFFMGAFIAKFSSSYRPYGSSGRMMGAGMITIVYLVVAVVFFFVSLYLNRFASTMKTALQTNDQSTLNQSFKNIKVYFRSLGIITVIYLLFLFLFLIIGVGSALMR